MAFEVNPRELSNRLGFPIEPGIAPLVNILLDIQFIEPYSSCEAHYEDPTRQIANVRFAGMEGTEEGIDHFMQFLLQQVHSCQDDVQFLFHRTYWATPIEDGMRQTYSIEILQQNPCAPIPVLEERRDEAVYNLCVGIDRYLRELRKHE